MRAIVRSTARLARTPRLSYRRWGWASHESRRSATHGRAVAAATAAPIRCTDGGGDVVMIASMWRRRTIRTAAGTAVAAQGAALSGMSARS